MANTDMPNNGQTSNESAIPYAFYVVREQELSEKEEAVAAAQEQLAEKAAQVARSVQETQSVQTEQVAQTVQAEQTAQSVQAPVETVAQAPVEPVQPAPAPTPVAAPVPATPVSAPEQVPASATPIVTPAAAPAVTPEQAPVAATPATAAAAIPVAQPATATPAPEPAPAVPVQDETLDTNDSDAFPVPPVNMNRVAANPTVRPVTLGTNAPDVGTPTGSFIDEDMEAVSAYKTLEARRKRKRRNRIIAGCIIGALALGAGGWWAVNNLAPAPAVEEESFDIGYVVLDTYENSVSASGAIKPETQVVVMPEVEGTISEVNFAEGDNVLKGDVLVVLKNDSLDKAIQEAEQGLKAAENTQTSAQNALNSASNNLAKAQDNYNKVFSTLYDTQEIADAAGAEATDVLNSAQDAYNSAELALEDAQILVTKAQETLEDAKANAEKRSIRAPEGGAIIDMNAEVGANVGTGSSTTGALVTIADLSTLRVSVQVNEVDINNLKEGQVAEVTFSALPDTVLSATVEHIAAVSTGSGDQNMAGGIVTYDVDLVIEEPDPQVKPGMTARVRILTEQIENAFTVPTAALQMTSDTEATIMVAPGYTGEGTPEFEERSVSVVAQDSSMAVVEGDIADGDAVQLFMDSISMDGEEY